MRAIPLGESQFKYSGRKSKDERQGREFDDVPRSRGAADATRLAKITFSNDGMQSTGGRVSGLNGKYPENGSLRRW